MRVVCLLSGYHSNADNKFIDDNHIISSGKNETKIEYKMVFRNVCLDSCKIQNTTMFVHHKIHFLVESYFLPRRLLYFVCVRMT